MIDKLTITNEGFTLIEILVALALISVVGIGATQFLTSGTNFEIGNDKLIRHSLLLLHI